MHAHHELFINAIHGTQKVRVTFFSKEDLGHLVRLCAPMDYAISNRYKDGLNRYWFWDYESDSKPHPIGLLANQIVNIEMLAETFEPGEFVDWDTSSRPWTVVRSWGPHS